MSETYKDNEILNVLQKMTNRKKLSFTIGCLERLDAALLFNNSDALLFVDTLMVMKTYIDGATHKAEIDALITYIAPRCGVLHQTASGKPHLIKDQYNAHARSYATDAIYAGAEFVYHYLASENCPMNVMHVLENICLSQKWHAKNCSQTVDREKMWQLHFAESLLNNK
ncbi:MAG: hypothetical protein ACI8QY_000562, partial [bacterium]